MGRNLMVMIVDPDIDHRAQLKETLSGLSYAVVAEATYGVEASRLAMEMRPEVILLHAEEPYSLSLRAVELVTAAAPKATVVVLSRLEAPTLVAKAMLADAHAFVPSPPNQGDLDETIQTAYARVQRRLHPELGEETPTAGTVITVFSPKGGVGKTTLWTNLAVAIKRRSSARVAVLDLDTYFGDVAVMLGLQPTLTIGDYLAALRADGAASVTDHMTTHESGVDVLAAPRGVDESAQPTTAGVAQLVHSLARVYDFVVVDTPGAFGPRIAAALDESAIVLLVSSADVASVKDAGMALDVLRGAGFDTNRLKLVLNHATNANAVSDADVAQTLAYPVWASIPHDRAVPMSTQSGVPVTMSNPGAAMTRSVDSIAGLISQSPGDTVVRPRFARFPLGRAS